LAPTAGRTIRSAPQGAPLPELCADHMCRKGYPLRYSGGAPSAPGDPQRARFPQERRSRAESGALAHIRRGNCTEVNTPLCRYGRANATALSIVGTVHLIGACHHHGVAQPSPVHPTRKHLDKTTHIGDSEWVARGLTISMPRDAVEARSATLCGNSDSIVIRRALGA